ncbi:MAG: SBBP repeat-containing protein [bacterium]|nr:SBBP repeat-containing protein [bacterium]
MRKLFILLIGFILPIQIFAQAEMWVARYDEYGQGSGAFAMAVDDSGYIYVTGSSFDTISLPDYATIKYNSSGDTIWSRRYNGPDKYSADDAYAIAVDKSGNVYVTGRSSGIGTYYDYATVKYNSSGDEMWVRRYTYGGSNSDVPIALTVDNNGNVYVTGESCSGADFDYATIKYDSLGNTLWTRRYNGPSNYDDDASAIVVDGDGNVYVTGRSASSISYDYLTIKYNSAGDTVWVRRYGKPGYVDNEANAIAVDDSGNVYVGGMINDTISSNFGLIKYNSSGDTMWSRIYSRTTKGYGNAYKRISAITEGKGNKMLWSYDGITALTLDKSGNVYVTGMSYTSATYYDCATIKYNSSGDTMWVRRYDGPSHRGDGARALTLDNSGNVYVTGWSHDTVTNADYLTIKYSSSGNEEWIQKYDGPINDQDNSYAIALDNKGYVYVTGSSLGFTGFDYATIKYSCVGVEEEKSNIKNQKLNIQIFPNPFVSKTVVSGSSSGGFRSAQQGEETKIQIYDIAGKLVETTKDNIVGKNLKSGIYFARVNDSKPVKIVKMSYIR